LAYFDSGNLVYVFCFTRAYSGFEKSNRKLLVEIRRNRVKQISGARIDLKKNRKMLAKKMRSMIVMFILTYVFLTLFTFSASFVDAGDGSIAMANTYPENDGTYVVVDHFLYQVTGINTNTTVSVRIDNGQPLSLVYQGVKNELALNDTVACEWYTWQVTISQMPSQGKHTFQFFSHYYVWQEQDHYWAEFNACSTLKSFTIADPLLIPAEPMPATTTNSIYVIAALTSPLSALLLITAIKRHRSSVKTGLADYSKREVAKRAKIDKHVKTETTR
jgi:hypothetical protein